MVALSKRDGWFGSDRSDRWLFITVIASAVAEVALTAVRLTADEHAIDLAEHAPGASSSYNLAGSLGMLGTAVAIPEAVVGLVLVIVLMSWRSALTRRGATGPRQRQLARTRSFRFWRVAIVLWLLQAFFLSTGLTTGTAVNQAIGLLNRDVAFQVLRLVVAALSVWCAFTLRDAAGRRPAQQPTTGPLP